MYRLKRILLLTSAVALVGLFATGSGAQMSAAGTATPSPSPSSSPSPDLNSLPPEVRQLIPQNQGGSATATPQPTAIPALPPGVLPPPYPNPPSQEAFPDFRSQPRSNATPEVFAPSEVISVLPPVAKTSELRAVLRTSVGDITIKLDRANAPLTVAHFVGLARGEKEFIDVKTSKPTKKPFYNGLTFHKVMRGYYIQTGCPFGTGRGTAGDIAKIADEIKPTMKFNRPGLVAMAPQRDAAGLKLLKDTNSSQFFITTKEMPSFDDQFTIFGEVEDGMDVVEKIASVKVGPTDRPIKRVYLVAVDIIEGVMEK